MHSVNASLSDVLQDGGAWRTLGRIGCDGTVLNDITPGLLGTSPLMKPRLAWFAARRAGIPTELQAPIGVPILATGEPGQPIGWIGWLRAVPHGERITEGWEPAALEVETWARQLGLPELRLGFDRTNLDPAIWGPSSGLSAFLAAGLHVLGVDYPPNGCLACTGQWEQGENRQWRLAPVAAETLTSKAAVARIWGYDTLAVIEGQEGLQNARAVGLSVITLSREPGLALLELVSRLGVGLDEDATVELLALFDRASIRTDPTGPYQRVHRLMEPYLEDHRHLVRALANDITARAALHNGISDTAATCHAVTRCALNQSDVLPAGQLGLYLKYHLHAHAAVVAIDTGSWDQHGSVWQDLEAARAASGGSRRPIDHIFAHICLNNAQARWTEYLGRWNQDIVQLRQSWQLRTAEMAYWTAAVKYAQRIGFSDSSLERWHHECIDSLVSWHDCTGRLPTADDLGGKRWQDLGLWVAGTQWTWDRLLGDPKGSYAILYALRWTGIGGPTAPGPERHLNPPVIDRLLGRLDRERPPLYPSFLIAESLLRWRLGSDEQRLRAGAQLASAPQLFPIEPTPEHNIVCLLARRSAMLIDRLDIRHRAPLSAPVGTPLALMQADLERDPEQLIRRCPY